MNGFCHETQCRDPMNQTWICSFNRIFSKFIAMDYSTLAEVPKLQNQ